MAYRGAVGGAQEHRALLDRARGPHLSGGQPSHQAVRLLGRETSGTVRPEDIPGLEPWARLWHLWVSAAFLKAYLAEAGQVSFLPQGREELQVLLDAHLLEKAIYELGYELNNR
jgi:hypothetical protein